MNNSDRYKQAFSVFNPSDEAVEKVFEITVDRKICSKNLWVRRVVACVMAFALLVGSCFGVNYAVNKSDNDFGVIVAYASGDTFKVGSINEQKLFYGIYVMPTDNSELSRQVYNRWNVDVNKVMTECEKLGKSGYTASCGKGSTGNDAVLVNHIMGGSFALNLDDYSDVKTFKVENSSEYGILMFDHILTEEQGNFIQSFADVNNIDDIELTPEEQELLWSTYIDGNEFTISGDQLRRSKESGFYRFYEGGIKHIVNYGYTLEWDMSMELVEKIEEDPYFDLSQITDTITFTVEFNDGTIKTASINLYFDSDGYMHFAD